MKSNLKSKSDLLILERLESIRMTDRERVQARAAFESAARVVGAVDWMVEKAQGLIERLTLTPSVRH